MVRHHINLGYFQYIADLYDADTDMKDNMYYSQFVMLRNVSITNDIAQDNDVYIIDRYLFTDLCEFMFNDENGDGLTNDVLCWPIPNSKCAGFSTQFTKFNENLSEYSLYDVETGEFGPDVYELIDPLGNPAEIPCDKFRIYNPINKSNTDAIVYIQNFINNIHFHFLCRRWDSYTPSSETEFKVENQAYSEYIEVYFPNLKYLFGKSDYDERNTNFNVYYRENLDIVGSKENEQFLTEQDILSDTFYDEEDGTQLIPMRLLVQPYRIVEETFTEYGIKVQRNVKQYLQLNKSIENNYLTYPINIVMFPFDDIDDDTGQYMLSTDYSTMGSNTYTTDVKIGIHSNIGFSEGQLSVISRFTYPMSEYFETLVTDDCSAFRAAYQYLNNVTPEMYDTFSEERAELLYGEIDAITANKLTTNDIKQVVKKYNLNYTPTPLEAIDKYKEMRKEAIRLELEEKLKTSADFLGIKVRIATDIKANNVIYESNESIQFRDLDDYAFRLNGIFDSWYELPEHLIVYTTFIDRLVGVEMRSNYVVITKEWFKYMVNDLSFGVLSQFTERNEEFKNRITEDNINQMREISFADSDVNFNFLNNVTCIIRKTDENVLQEETQKISNTPRVIYKPIFYRVQPLQTISMRANTIQNIGINLASYMTKVETFKLYIDGTQYIETGRNDVYVIFRINAGSISNSTGTYDIVNQDDEYISSGTYSVG